MAANDTKHEPRHEKIERPEGASKDAVISDVGATEPPQVFGGDGVTPIAEWSDKIKGLKEKHAEHDKKMRDRAIEHSGTLIDTKKGV